MGRQFSAHYRANFWHLILGLVSRFFFVMVLSSFSFCHIDSQVAHGADSRTPEPQSDQQETANQSAARLMSRPRSNCDIPGSAYQSFHTEIAKGCLDKCQNDRRCVAAVHVSGWNRCFLKEQFSRFADLTMISGFISTDSGTGSHLANNQPATIVDRRTFGELRMDYDSTGKDIRRLSPVESATVCQSHCAKESACDSFTYLDGYRDCWLKAAGGKERRKVFTCSRKG